MTQGNGFLGQLLKTSVWPLLKKALPFLGEHLMSTGANVLTDMRAGSSLKSSAKKRFRDTALDMGEQGLAKLRTQKGTGSRKRCRPSSAALLLGAPPPPLAKRKRRTTARKAVKGKRKKAPATRKKRRTSAVKKTKKKKKTTSSRRRKSPSDDALLF